MTFGLQLILERVQLLTVLLEFFFEFGALGAPFLTPRLQLNFPTPLLTLLLELLGKFRQLALTAAVQ